MKKVFLAFTICSYCFSLHSQDHVTPYIAIDTPVVAFTHSLLIDGRGTVALNDQTVVIRDGKIIMVGPTATTTPPSGAYVIDMTGKTITPGFVMMHEHMYYTTPSNGEFSRFNQLDYTFPKMYLAGGTTTARTAGSVDPLSDLNLRKWIAEGVILGPDLDITAPYLQYGKSFGLMQWLPVESDEELLIYMRQWKNMGFTSFKMYEGMPDDKMKLAINTAHDMNVKITGHICSVSFRDAASLGIDNLEHGFIVASDFVENREKNECPGMPIRWEGMIAFDVDGPEIIDLIKHLVQNEVAITSTLPVFETFAKGRPVIYAEALDALSPRFRESYLRNWSAINSFSDTLAAAALKREMVWEKAFFDAGGLLLAGTDPTGYGGVIAGFANMREIEMLAESGLTVEQAIQVSSYNGAVYLGLEEQIGSIEVGKDADLVVIDGDLLENLANIRKIQWVFKHGVGYDSQKIWEATKGKVGIY